MLTATRSHSHIKNRKKLIKGDIRQQQKSNVLLNNIAIRVYLHSFSRSCLQTCQLAQNSEKIYSSSGSSKVDDFGTNRKRIYEFLLVINSNCGLILHRF